jgi:hypothetical protein
MGMFHDEHLEMKHGRSVEAQVARDEFLLSL